MNKIPEISVFFPAYNEEKNIVVTVKSTIPVLKKVSKKYEIIVINDGSTDNTKTEVQKIIKTNVNVKIITHKKNKGYGAAIKSGLYACKYKFITHMDSDGQFSFEEIENFIKKIETHDVVLGYRKKRTDSIYRRILQKILWITDWILFGLNVKDVDCGFKLFRKEVVDSIGKLKTESAITETEFVVRAFKTGFSIAEVGVDHHPRQGGSQTGGKIKVIAKAAYEGLKLWWFLNIKEKNKFL